MGKRLHTEYHIIDAHTHVIEHLSGYGRRGELRPVGSGRARWANGEEFAMLAEGYGDISFVHDRLIQEMNEHEISQAIMMQGSYYGFCNEYTFEAQEKYPDRLFGMGTFDPYCLDYLNIMRRLIKDFKFRGLKFEMSAAYGFMGYHPDFLIDGDRMKPVWAFAQDENLTVSLDMGTFGEPSMQTDGLARIASQYPGIQFVVEHLFFPAQNRAEEVRKELEKLSSHQNISFTTASIPIATSPEKYPFPTACQYLEIARDIVGSKRLMWGSDLPSVIIHASYTELIDYIVEAGIFTGKELRDIYCENARKVYRL